MVVIDNHDEYEQLVALTDPSNVAVPIAIRPAPPRAVGRRPTRFGMSLADVIALNGSRPDAPNHRRPLPPRRTILGLIAHRGEIHRTRQRLLARNPVVTSTDSPYLDPIDRA
jgi:hypothetical protein